MFINVFCSKSLLSAVFVGIFCCFNACVMNQTGTPMPDDSFHYPMGARLLPESDFMVVTSSNFDLRYLSGQIHLVDLASANAALANNSPAIPLSDVSLATLPITSFGSAPVLLSTEDKTIGWVHRDQTGLFSAEITSESTLSCLGNFETVCGASENLETMAAHPARPFSDGFSLWIPHLSEGTLSVFHKGKEDERWIFKTSLDFTETLSNIRMGTYSESTSSQKRLWLAGQFYNPGTLNTESTLIWFLNPETSSELNIEKTFNITEATGSTTINDLAFSSDESRLFLALQNPDGIAVMNVEQQSYQTPLLQLQDLVGSCDDPTRMATFEFDSTAYIALSCFDEDTLWIYRQSDMKLVTVREDDGKGPRDLLWDPNNQTLWVSYFKSHFMGAYQFEAVDTSLDIKFKGRLGITETSEATNP